MADSLLTWTDLMSETANIAQLSGLDFSKVIRLVIKVAKNPQILKRRCRRFGQRLQDIWDLLQILKEAELMEDTRIRKPLNRLEDAVKKAFIPVDICQKGSMFELLTSGCAISKCLNEAQEEVEECYKNIPLVHFCHDVMSQQECRKNAQEDEKWKKKIDAQVAASQRFMFKHLLDEISKDITYKTDYEWFAKKWGHDERFKVLDCKERESLFNERVISLRKTLKEKVKARQVAPIDSFSHWPEEKLKERKRETRKEREEQEMERVRLKARRKDAVTSYQALLTERIKDCEASWTESKPKLEKDPLGRATNSDLDLAERERLFREHVNGLYERCVREYRSLLADVITVDMATKDLEDGKNILTSWSEAKRLLKPDQRYARMPRRERELWWRRYADDVQRRVKVTGSERNEDKPNVDDSGKRSPGVRKKQSRR